MATVPRYIGTTADEAIEYLRETLDEEFGAVFDSNGDGTVAADSADGRALVRAVCAAETEVDEILGASNGAPFTGVVPDTIKEIVALRSLWCRVRLRATMTDDLRAPYRTLYKDTTARLERIASDNRGRIPELGPSRPTATLPLQSAPSFWTDEDGNTAF